jgi:hypothetical protein
VLGAVLLGTEQPLRVARAGARRPGDRVHVRAAAFELHEGFGRGADEREVVELQQEEVRGGVDAAKRAVEVERGGGRSPLGPLREHDLERVAGADVLLRPPHARLVTAL